jgi:hypothetical protein
MSWKMMSGAWRSRAISATAAVRLPPALSPPTAIRVASTPRSVALATTHSVAA